MSGHGPPGSVPLAARSAGPDLARGLALLGIGLANLVGWLHGTPWTVLLKQAEATALDRGVDVVLALLVDNRGFPLFALLFGYGIGILHRRATAAGTPPRRFLLLMVRRHTVLLGLGLLHAVLLFSGDILVAYALIGTLCAMLVTRRPLMLPVAAIVTLPALGLWGWADGVIALSGGDGYAAASAAGYEDAVRLRLGEAGREVATGLLLDIGLLSPMALGALAARGGLLEDVRRHHAALRFLTRWGITAGLIGAVPLVIVLVADPAQTRWPSTALLGTLGVIHQLSGLLGAIGIAAGVALAAHRIAQGSPAVVSFAAGGMQALGAMSLTGYLALSLGGALLFPPATLDLGGQLGSAAASGLVLTQWILLVLIASALARRGRRGPAEALLRTLAPLDPPPPLPSGART